MLQATSIEVRVAKHAAWIWLLTWLARMRAATLRMAAMALGGVPSTTSTLHGCAATSLGSARS
jgi:hypothetical protein